MDSIFLYDGTLSLVREGLEDLCVDAFRIRNSNLEGVNHSSHNLTAKLQELILPKGTSAANHRFQVAPDLICDLLHVKRSSRSYGMPTRHHHSFSLKFVNSTIRVPMNAWNSQFIDGEQQDPACC
jgi:hypothetical protein